MHFALHNLFLFEFVYLLLRLTLFSFSGLSYPQPFARGQAKTFRSDPRTAAILSIRCVCTNCIEVRAYTWERVKNNCYGEWMRALTLVVLGFMLIGLRRRKVQFFSGKKLRSFPESFRSISPSLRSFVHFALLPGAAECSTNVALHWPCGPFAHDCRPFGLVTAVVPLWPAKCILVLSSVPFRILVCFLIFKLDFYPLGTPCTEKTSISAQSVFLPSLRTLLSFPVKSGKKSTHEISR